MKCYACRILDEKSDIDDIGFLLRYLNIKDYDTAIKIIGKFYSIDMLPVKACPAWIFDRRLYFTDPVFPEFLERTDPEKKSKLRILLMVESPPQFKVRNIFISGNSLARA